MKLYFCSIFALLISLQSPLFPSENEIQLNFLEKLRSERASHLDAPVYVVYSSKDRIYLVLVFPDPSGENAIVVLEATKDILTLENLPSWKQWLEEGAPSAISRTSSTLSSASSGQLPHFLQLLLKTPLNLVSMHERKKIGPFFPGEIDRRALWQPPLFYEGKEINPTIPSDEYSLIAPDDGSEFAKKRFFVFFAKKGDTTPKPFDLLPTWIESEGRHFILRVVDSDSLLSTEESTRKTLREKLRSSVNK